MGFLKSWKQDAGWYSAGLDDAGTCISSYSNTLVWNQRKLRETVWKCMKQEEHIFTSTAENHPTNHQLFFLTFSLTCVHNRCSSLYRFPSKSFSNLFCLRVFLKRWILQTPIVEVMRRFWRRLNARRRVAKGRDRTVETKRKKTETHVQQQRWNDKI